MQLQNREQIKMKESNIIENQCPQIEQKEVKQYMTSNLKCPDTYLFTSQKTPKEQTPTQKPISQYNFQPSYFQIDQSNCGFTKEIDTQFKCNILICRGCDLLIGYKTFIIQKEKNFMILSALLNYKIDPEADDECFLKIYCMGCNEELGIKVKNQYYIHNVMVCEKNRIMTVAIISLKKNLTEEFEELLKVVNQQLNLQITIHHFYLQKSKLQNFKLQFNYDICIIIHKEEGRLLLFDENGMYNDVYRECFRNTKGNVLFILLLSDYHNTYQIGNNKNKTQQNFSDKQDNKQILKQDNHSQSTQDISQVSSKSDELKQNEDDKSNVNSLNSSYLNHHNEQFSINSNPIWDKNFIKEISQNSKQPLLYLLSKNQLVVTIVEHINIFQINFLMNFLHNSLYKPLIPSDLKLSLNFTKIYLKIKIDKCQKAILQYFIEQFESKAEYNKIIQQLQQYIQENENKKQEINSNQSNSNNNNNSYHTKNESQDNNQKCTIF